MTWRPFQRIACKFATSKQHLGYDRGRTFGSPCNDRLARGNGTQGIAPVASCAGTHRSTYAAELGPGRILTSDVAVD